MSRPKTAHMSIEEYREYLAGLAIARSEKELAAAIMAEKRAIREEVLGPSAPRKPRAPMPTGLAEYEQYKLDAARRRADAAARAAVRARSKGRVMAPSEATAIVLRHGAAGYDAARRERLHFGASDVADVATVGDNDHNVKTF